MAKQRMVTRTIITLKATALILNKETAEVTELTELFQQGTSEAKMLKKFNEKLSDDLKAVAIKEIVEIGKYYGMTESDFISHATEIEVKE